MSITTKKPAKSTKSTKPAKAHKNGAARKFAKPGTKQEIVFNLVNRKQGATGKEVKAATGWPSVALVQHVNDMAYRLGMDFEWFPRVGGHPREIAYKLVPASAKSKAE